jgi:outer membrane protein TolC
MNQTPSIISGAMLSAMLLAGSNDAAPGQISTNFSLSENNHLAASASPGRPESLETAWSQALAAAHRLKASQLGTASARQTLAAARASRLPSVSAAGGHFSLDQAPTAVVNLPTLPGLPIVLDDEFWAGQVTTTVPLFTSGQIRSAVDMAKAGFRAAQAEERRDTLDLKMGVADAYVQILRVTRAVQVVSSSVASLESHSQSVSNLYAKGLVSKNDLLASQVALADARQREIQARNALDLANANYNRLLVRPLTNSVVLEDLTPPEMLSNVTELTARALKERPELEMLSAQAEALRKEARNVRASALPSVGVSGGYYYLENSVLERDHAWVVGVVGTWNIFDGGLARHKARAVDDKAEAMSALREEVADSVALQVRQAWLGVDETRRRLGVTRDAVEQSQENLRVARERYRTGLGTNTEVLDAETFRTRALSNHDNAIYDAVLASLRLRRAVGDL